MMISPFSSIGCDIEEIDRFLLDREKDAAFLERIFTRDELEYCFSYQNPAPHLAARFCAKEAVVKALCSVGNKPVEYRRIEVINLPSGVPVVSIHPEDSSGEVGYTIQVSLSHCRTTAMAVAVILRNEIRYQE